MNKECVKVPAKINLTLDVLGKNGNYHEISSLVARIDLCDYVTVKARKDGLITLTERGIASGCELANNNAYKAGKAFSLKFKTTGADIALKKNIPVGAGLGGSSADIAGTLIAMKKVYEIPDEITEVADSLGSDSGYMSKEGAAIMRGRGERVEPFYDLPTLYILLITEDGKCSSAECYKKFDEIGKNFQPCTESAVNALKEGDLTGFFAAIKNDLTESACAFIPQIKENIEALKNVGAKAALMTGSGSASYGVFLSAAKRNAAYKKLLPLFGERLIKTKTI